MQNFNTRLTFALLMTIFLILAVVVGFYVYNFHDSGMSNKSGDWGTLGDYFGGILNPIISTITLFFVAKTYMTQRNELIETKKEMDKIDKARESSTNAQVSLAASYLKQIQISAKLTKIQLTSSKIDFCYKNITIFQGEINRVTISLNNNRAFYDLHGNQLYSDGEQKKYRDKMILNIQKEQEQITLLQKQMDIQSSGD
jgi:uncharacterized membrane protein